MPVKPTYPGVYIEEVPSGVRTITGVATAITAFIGRAVRGPVNDPVRIQSYGDYDRGFGGLSLESPMSYSAQHFFQNGGTDAIIVRVYRNPSAAQVTAGAAVDGIANLSLMGAGVAAQGTLTVATNPSDGDTMTIDTKVYTFDDATPAVAAQGTLTLANNPSDGDTMTIDTKVYTFDDATLAVAAQGTLALANNPSDGDTMTIDTKVYTFQSVLDDQDGNIQIGSGVAATRANIVGAINLSGTAGTDYGASMTVHPTVEAASAFVGTALVLTAKSPGASGNSIATTETFTAGGNVFDGATLGTTTAGADPADSIRLAAANPGAWANNLRVTVDHAIGNPSDMNAFNLEFEEIDPRLPATAPPVRSEKFFNVSVDPASPLFVDKVLESRSTLVRVRTPSSERPGEITRTPFVGGSDGQVITDAEISDSGLEGDKQGLWSLEKADLFNLLCIPPLTFTTDVGSTTRDAALKYCKDRRAFYILDSPSSWYTVRDAEDGVDELNLRDENVGVYFPRVKMVDPLRDNQLSTFVPSGVVAGIYARTDARRGVWKAPAGTEATMSGVRKLEVPLTDGENGRLNPLGVNCLRTFPVVGNLVWGARTLEGADQLASEWKYVPVRRTALFIEESLYRGLQWVVFEPNDEPLWAQIRLNVGSFMHTLFRQGAFQGSSPKEAYLVKCDKETTTQADIDRGVVNIIVGFAPLKPAEFVFIKIQQLAGQLQT